MLNVGDNNIGDWGAESLSEALCVNSSVTYLDASSNSIGVRILALVLFYN